MAYDVIDPDQIYRGKSYNDWAKDYFTWYFSADPDEHNDGPVVFLKSTPSLSTLVSSQLTTENNMSAVPQFIFKYMRQPNVMVGLDKLDIDIDQAILLPAIVAYFSLTEPSDNIHTLKNFVRDAAENSDNPPNNNQIKINNNAINVQDMKNYSLETDVFMLPVPDVEPGWSYKDYVEYPPLPPGTWPTVGGGYFFLLKFTDRGTYVISSRVKGKKYLDGRDYFADLLYQISVH
jgi:hypothetical protein